MSTALAIRLQRHGDASRERDAADIGHRILSSCHPAQRDFVVDDSRRVAALVGRGGGKTTGARAKLLLCMESTPDARCLFIATTRGQAEELMWGPLKTLLDKLKLFARYNETKLKCTLENGATLRLVGADNKAEIEKLRGQPFHLVVVDEAASYPAHLLDALLKRIIGPRLGDYGGSLVLIGTPGHIQGGPFYEATRPGSALKRPYSDRHKPEYAEWSRWSFHAWSLEDGAKHVPALQRLWAEALIEKAANAWRDDNPIWLREYRGQWAADDTENMFRYRPHITAEMIAEWAKSGQDAAGKEGEPWNQWDPERDAEGMAVLDGSGWEFVYAHDLGHSDPYALNIFAYHPDDVRGILYHVYEFEAQGMFARAMARVLLGSTDDAMPRPADKPGGLIGKTGWPVGHVADMAGLGGAVLKEMAEVYGVAISAADKKSKADNIELLNGDFVDGRFKVLKGSKLESELQSLQWSVDDYGGLKEPKGVPNHHSDTALYGRREARNRNQSIPAAVEEKPSKSRSDAPTEPDDTAGDEYESWLADDEYQEEFAW